MLTINIAKKEFENSLVQLIQESNIPACILVDIFQKYIYQLQAIADAEYEKDMKNLQQQDEKSNIEQTEKEKDTSNKVIDPRK